MIAGNRPDSVGPQSSGIPNMASEAVSLIDSAGNVAVVTVTLNDYDGGDRLLHVLGALWTRTGKDGSQRKQFTFLRSQRP